MTDKIIIVCGLGRCGSSLVMQMLHAGGLRCNGVYPTFEHVKVSMTNNDPEWLTRQTGKATKLLMPDLHKFYPADYQFIWLDRSPLEQAKSSFKFAHFINNGVFNEKIPLDPKGRDIVKMERNYKRWRYHGIKAIKKHGPITYLDFEDIIMYPHISANAIWRVVPHDLDVEKMAMCVLPRSTECSLNMDIEAGLMKNGKRDDIDKK